MLYDDPGQYDSILTYHGGTSGPVVPPPVVLGEYEDPDRPYDSAHLYDGVAGPPPPVLGEYGNPALPYDVASRLYDGGIAGPPPVVLPGNYDDPDRLYDAIALYNIWLPYDSPCLYDGEAYDFDGHLLTPAVGIGSGTTLRATVVAPRSRATARA